MNTCDYSVIFENGKNDKIATPFWRQIFICSAAWNVGFCLGVSMGTNTVAIPQMIKENIYVSDTLRSWLAAAFGFGSVFWLLILTPIIHKFGVKKAYLIVCASPLVGSTIIFFSKSSSQFFIGQIIHSMMQTSMTSISIMALTEYVSPINRSFALLLKSASLYWGVWLANALGTFFYWRYIPALVILCSLYGLTVFFWPESPFWLASKGRMDECANSFRWARGVNSETELELKKIIEFQKNNREKENINDYFNWLISKEFYKPMFLSFLFVFMYLSTGKLVCTMYAIELLENMTTSKWAYYSMLILDGINVIGMYCGCYLARKSNQRRNLFILSGVGISCLYLLSIQNFLVRFNFIDYDFKVSIAFLIVYSLAICTGPLMLAPALTAELFPLKNRLFFSNFFTVVGQITLGVFLKLAPYLFSLGLNVMFLIYAVLASVCCVLLFILLPKTQGMTNVEINDLFCKPKKKYQNEVELRTEFDKSLLSGPYYTTMTNVNDIVI